MNLPALPLTEWEAAKDTLHLWTQVVGKLKLPTTPSQNHWWNVTLHVGARGLTTGRMRWDDLDFELQFDFVDDALVVLTSRGAVERVPLHDGLSVAEFHDRLLGLLPRLGIGATIEHPVPFGVPMTTPFADDTEHASYDHDAVNRYWRALSFSDWTMREFQGWFCGKASPVQLFWHSFDLATTRFSPRRVTQPPGTDPVTVEAYTHEVVSFGFWAGDRDTRFPAYYSYTAPAPDGLTDQPLHPAEASWNASGGMAVLPYDVVRAAADPRETLLEFLQSGYDAGATLIGWDRADLRTDACPY